MDKQTLLHTVMVWAGIGMIFFALTMVAVTDVLRKDFGSMQKKVLWGLVALFPFIGWLLYFLLGFRLGKVVRDQGTGE